MIAVKLTENPDLIVFFLNEKSANSFPLYATAVKMYDNGESMIRTSVRTIILSMYSCKNLRIICSVAACKTEPCAGSAALCLFHQYSLYVG